MGTNSITELDTSQWFLILSNIVFLLPASLASRRNEIIRALGFTAVAGVSAMYHFCADTTVCGERAIYRELDHVLAVWLIVTITLLFSSWHREIEYLVEVIALGGIACLILLYTGTENDTHNLIIAITIPTGVFLLVVIPSWSVHGVPPGLRIFMGRVIVGLCIIGVGIAFFFARIVPNQNYNHGLWHIAVALGAAVLITGLRDSHLRNIDHYSALRRTT